MSWRASEFLILLSCHLWSTGSGAPNTASFCRTWHVSLNCPDNKHIEIQNVMLGGDCDLYQACVGRPSEGDLTILPDQAYLEYLHDNCEGRQKCAKLRPATKTHDLCMAQLNRRIQIDYTTIVWECVDQETMTSMTTTQQPTPSPRPSPTTQDKVPEQTTRAEPPPPLPTQDGDKDEDADPVTMVTWVLINTDSAHRLTVTTGLLVSALVSVALVI